MPETRIVLTHPYCWPHVRRGTERNMDGLGAYLTGRGYPVTTLSAHHGALTEERTDAGRRLLYPDRWHPLLGKLRIQGTHTFFPAALQGINSNRISMIAIAVGAAMAGLAGALMAPLTNINPHMGHNVIITAFIVTIVGGIGSLPGAVLAAFLYAFLHTFVTAYVSGTVATMCGLLIMVLVLIVKPTGIMGQRVSE